MGELLHSDRYECPLPILNAWPAQIRSHRCIQTIVRVLTKDSMLRHLAASGRRAAVLRHFSPISQVCMLVQMSNPPGIPIWLLQMTLPCCNVVVSRVCTLPAVA
jgi:hypothetical protein